MLGLSPCKVRCVVAGLVSGAPLPPGPQVELSHSGPSEVHLTGYRVEQMVGGSDDDEGAYGHYREGGGGLLPPPASCPAVCRVRRDWRAVQIALTATSMPFVLPILNPPSLAWPLRRLERRGERGGQRGGGRQRERGRGGARGGAAQGAGQEGGQAAGAVAGGRRGGGGEQRGGGGGGR